MYIGNILICKDDTFYCSNPELVKDLADRHEPVWVGRCDDYAYMRAHIDQISSRFGWPAGAEKFKYLIGTCKIPDVPTEMAVVFPRHYSHGEFAFLFSLVLYAGLVQFQPNSVITSGKSHSLSKTPGATDKHVLKRCLGDNYWRGKF